MAEKSDLTKTKSEIAQGYDEIATRIGMSPGFYDALLRFCGPIIAPLLDVGCGGGHLLAFLKAQAALPASALHGIDISHRLCSMSFQKTSADVLQSDAETLPFRDGQFQTVFMTEVLEHILAPQKAFAEIHRVLRSDGTWILTVPNRDWLRYDFYMRRKERFQPVDDRFYRLSEIEQLARQTGFVVADSGGYGSLRHGGPVWGMIERVQLALSQSLRTKRKRLFVKLRKARDR